MLQSRSDLQSYAAGKLQPSYLTVNISPLTRQTLAAGSSWHWSLTLPANKLGLSCFGVYPLTVQVTDAALNVASDPVPMPFWPTNPKACSGQRRPHAFPVSWVWPLIDVPHQTACAGLTTNRLATSIAPGGRLGSLLAVGARYSASARLTWAIDPSLLDAVQTMRTPYRIGASAVCSGGKRERASPTAGHWIAGLRKATAGQMTFLTPYADVNVASLTNHGKYSDLHRAFVAGDQVGNRVLHRTGRPSNAAGPHQFSAIAWPPDGLASRQTLDALITQANVRTVILAAPTVSPVTYTPGAVTGRRAGIGKSQHILLADHTITALLGSKPAVSGRPGDIFGTSQRYLAETAMIASERPNHVRPIMIAPPRRWDPPRQLASDLLADTVSAPWLRPSTVSQLAAMRQQHVYPSVLQG